MANYGKGTYAFHHCWAGSGEGDREQTAFHKAWNSAPLYHGRLWACNGGVIHNETKWQRIVFVNLNASGAKIVGRSWQWVKVPASGEAVVEWEVEPETVGDVVFKANAWSWFVGDNSRCLSRFFRLERSAMKSGPARCALTEGAWRMTSSLICPMT